MRLSILHISEAARRLLDVAARAAVPVMGYRSGVSIRPQVRGRPYTVAWLLAPETPESSWLPVRHFTFGAGSNNLDHPSSLSNMPEDVRAILEPWADQFASDRFTRKDVRAHIKREGVKAWCVSYDEVEKHIDVLAERLHRVLSELNALDGAGARPWANGEELP